tara:strand:- start:61 stop:195 length:135 start_codon:yes stop_codon:yes gene_type:complete
MYIEFVLKISLIDLKLQQLKKFLKERKKLLKKKYLKKLVDKEPN